MQKPNNMYNTYGLASALLYVFIYKLYRKKDWKEIFKEC